jgi:transcriptional regulator with XRE-family HTH domain
MAQSEEAERFAVQLRTLRERAGLSYGELAKRTGVSKSSLHRYCSGTKFPTSYGVVHTFAKVCGGSGEELRELHRLWALADTARSSSPPQEATERDESSVSPVPPPDSPVVQPRPRGRLLVFTFAIGAALVGAATAIVLFYSIDRSHASANAGKRPYPSGTTAPVHVYNVEGNCKSRADRIPACSMGLAINPRLKYQAGNVVGHRVWHGDTLIADCVLYDGDRVLDETGVGTTRWFRVRLSDVPGGYAWLPAVRTHDNPTLPTCSK